MHPNRSTKKTTQSLTANTQPVRVLTFVLLAELTASPGMHRDVEPRGEALLGHVAGLGAVVLSHGDDLPQREDGWDTR